ncbi:DPP IV N-terminal domain-containing protein [Isosphaeraceae bacterium EP7]
MNARLIALASAWAWVGLASVAAAQAPPRPAQEPEMHRVEPIEAARRPFPGVAMPDSFGFTPDGKSLTYLKPEGASLAKVLWKVDLAGGKPRVIARAPGEGVSERTVSPEEALRRERQRQTATGLAQVVRASAADATLIPINGDLYLQRGEGELTRLTSTPSPELDPKLDAAATRVAFVREGDLYVLDLATLAETRLTTRAADGLTHGLAEFIAQEELDRFSGYWWSPDGKTIAYQETDERHIPPYPIVHQGGTEVSVETHRYPFPGKANARVKLGIVGAGGGSTRWLELVVPTEDFYLARVTWESPLSLLVQTLSRDQKQTILARHRLDDGSRQVLIEERAEHWINLHDDLRIVEGTGELLWSTERSGFRHLELRDKNGKLVRTLTEGDWAVDPTATHAGSRGVVALDSARREAWFQGNRESPLESHLYRVSLDGGPVECMTNDAGTHAAAVSPDGEHRVVVSSDRSHPPVARLLDRAGAVRAELGRGDSDSRIAAMNLPAPELLEFRGRDGVRLFGAYYAPRSEALRSGAGVPVVVMLYGGPHVQTVTDSWTLTADMKAQLLASEGFAVWKMDNRGSSRRGVVFEAALSRDMGSVEVRDQVDGVAFLKTIKPEVDLSRVGVTGSSYGGYMTLRCLTEAPEVFQAGVANAPVTDWDGYDTGYTERYMGTPQENPAGYKASTVLTRVDRLRGSLLVIHGMLDENVHFRHTARLTTALIAAGKSFELIPLPEDRHSSRRESGRKYELDRTVEFFRRTLAGTKDAGAK